MSTAPAGARGDVEGEVRLLRQSLTALQEAIAAAERGREATNADLAAVQRRLITKTDQALPHDDGIRKRITTAIESSFATARRALTARWNEIVGLLTKACRRVQDELDEAERELKRREEAKRLMRQNAHRSG
ncbi:hypothetical protein [Jiangella anatolica]|uniref:Uncharacterized protein n=1 Tax=Jiangella anatolica TaxID=2670374 RepID=A0A2W2CU52_9ACTN|nr:hypothetical protein [Jiangella anatolica]PZF83693.1 hypothetical protein C1I92_11280 [Jiangella anatolica]